MPTFKITVDWSSLRDEKTKVEESKTRGTTNAVELHTNSSLLKEPSKERSHHLFKVSCSRDGDVARVHLLHVHTACAWDAVEALIAAPAHYAYSLCQKEPSQSMKDKHSGERGRGFGGTKTFSDPPPQVK